MMGYFEDQCSVLERPVESYYESEPVFWRLDPPVVSGGDIIRGGMWKSQRELWELDNFIKLLVGGYGSGKTFIGCKRIISLALQNAPCPVASISPTFPIARQTTIPTICTLLEGKRSLLGRSFWWKYNSSVHEFRIRFHGREGYILVYSGEKPLSLRGPNLAAVHIDEPFIQDEEVFKQSIARTRHPQAEHLEIMLTGTPEQLNWGYDIAEGEDAASHDIGVVRADTRDNLILPKMYVDRLLAAYDEKTALAYVEGYFVNLSKGTVYYAFDRQKNIVDLAPPEGVEFHVGMDFNVNPMAAVVFWKHREHMHVFDEIELPNADTEFMCDHLREVYKERITTVYPDATGSRRQTSAPGGKSDFYYIDQANFDVEARHANPKRKDRYNAVNSKLSSRKKEPTLTMSPKCKKLIKYLMTYSYELMNKQDAMSHLLAALGYPISYIWPVDKETLDIYRLQGV